VAGPKRGAGQPGLGHAGFQLRSSGVHHANRWQVDGFVTILSL